MTLKTNKIPYSVAMNYDSISDILIHVNSGESLRRNLAARDFFDWEDNKEYKMLEVIAENCAEEMDKLLAGQTLSAKDHPEFSFTEQRVLLAFEVAAKRLLTLYDDVISAYPKEKMLGDIISRSSAFCWNDVREQLPVAKSLRQYVLNQLTSKNVMAAAKEKVPHRFRNSNDAEMVFATFEDEIRKLLSEEAIMLATRRREKLIPGAAWIDVARQAIDKICSQIYQKHAPIIIANVTSEDSVQSCLDRQEYFNVRD